MHFHDLVYKTRSYRRFRQEPIALETMRELVDLARVAASGGNKQPLKYIICNDVKSCAAVFPCTAWAAALKDWPGPDEHQRPTAYVVILLDQNISENAGQDPGIAALTMALGAAERGIGACMIGSLNRVRLRELLQVSERYRIELALAMGIPDETVVLDAVPADGLTAYYRDASDVHHVPKRSLDDVIVS